MGFLYGLRLPPCLLSWFAPENEGLGYADFLPTHGFSFIILLVMISKTCRASQQCKKVIKQFFNDRNTNSQCYICLGAHQTFIFTEGGGKQLFYYRETITNSVTQSHFHCSNKSNMSFCNLVCFECEAALTIITQTPRKSDALGNALSCSSLIMFTQQQSTVSQP